MKILLAHNFYRSSAPSGEDSVYRYEKQMLQDNNLEVFQFERYNDDIDDSTLQNKIKIALQGAWSKETYNEITKLIHKKRPDIAHFHNTFPQISPSAYAACQDNNVPVVQTLHNYRFICPNALLLRDGKVCEDCLGGSLFPALKYRCYRNSFLATSAQVWAIARNRWLGSYSTQVNRYIALTEFAAKKLAAGGIPAERIEIKPNFLPKVPEMGAGEGGYLVYVGRLREEKGVRTLIDAWKLLENLPLKILGDGPLRSELEQESKKLNLPVEFLGYCNSEKIFEVVSQAVLQIIPSECYETFGMAVLEAYACGTPVISSRIGSLDELIIDGKTGIKFRPASANDLAGAIKSIYQNTDKLKKMRLNCRNLFLQKYIQKNNLKLLMQIYHNAIWDFEIKSSKHKVR